MPRVPNHPINRDVFTFKSCSSCAAHDSRTKRDGTLTPLDGRARAAKQEKAGTCVQAFLR
jgi:hypothetical protein